jgi:hypothetical protein
MKKTMIKFLQTYGASFYACGIVEAGTIFTANEFIEKFGCNAFDDIEDCFLDESEEVRAQGVEMWQNGMFVFIWEE